MHSGCGHTMCEECWQQYVLLKVSDADLISLRCAAPQCKEALPSSMLRSLLSDAMWKRLQEMLDDAHVSTATTLSYCPKPTCGRVLLRNTPNAALVNCSTCSGTWCPKCGGEPHWPARCDQVGRQRYGALEWGLSDTKRCPNCAIVIEKTGGCPHMRCSHCTAQFCWICGVHSMTTYPHYAGVPCDPENRNPVGGLSRLGLHNTANAVDIGLLETQYAGADVRRNSADRMWSGLAFESALVLRNVAWRLRSRKQTLPEDFLSVLQQLLRVHIAVAKTSVPRKAKARKSQRARFQTLIQRLSRHLGDDM